MKKINLFIQKWTVVLSCLFISSYDLNAQTEVDALMMNKNQFCSGFIFNYTHWDQYWEGTLKRSNENLGTVSTRSVMYMANYGITNKLNVMVGAPYVSTKASSGTLQGLNGIQDISFFIKWKPLSKTSGNHKISLFAIGGFSTPLSNYVIDFMPLSIGSGTTNVVGRGIIDYQNGKLNVTGSASYVRRSNVKIDRNSYYDTQLHYTNEVKMPDAAFYQIRAGYRGRYLIAEALLSSWTTLGGFDITRNNMPFPSNRMNATSVGVNVKYTLKNFTNLSMLAGSQHTIAGRNNGKSNAYTAGIFYAFYFKRNYLN